MYIIPCVFELFQKIEIRMQITHEIFVFPTLDYLENVKTQINK